MPLALVPGGSEPRDVLRGLRSALDGAGPALALGAAGWIPYTAPPGTAVVIATSGSTGVPKRVVLSRSALIASATATSDRIGEGRWLLALPATYVAGVQVLVRGMLAGHEPAVLSGSFSPAAFVAVSATMHSSVGGRRVPAFTSLVPAQLIPLLDAAGSDPAVVSALRSFEAILVGGQALPVEARDRAAALGVRIVRTYGSSETSGGCVYDGTALAGVGLRVHEGEVQISGPTLAEGYLGDEPLTARTFVRDDAGERWYRSGDAGELVDGVLRVTGRIDNVIVSGGVNVSLDRVEAAVRRVPGLGSAVVVPTADERWGEASVVVVTRQAVADDDPDAVLAAVRDAVADALGKPARPARLLVVDAMPLLPSGKPDRAGLRRLVS